MKSSRAGSTFVPVIPRSINWLDGDARWDGAKVTVTKVRGVALKAPVIITVDERSLAAAIDISAEDRDALWPGSGLADAGFNLLLVHIEELIDTGRFPIRITESGIETPEATPFTGRPLDPSDGPFELHSPLTGSAYTTPKPWGAQTPDPGSSQG